MLKPHHFYFISLGSVALALALVSSCAPGVSNEIESPSNVLSAAAVIESSATPQVKAEKLAVIADQLFSSGALSQALDVTDVALTFDQTNLRAGLISALAKPLVTLRGIAVRVAPLALTVKADYENLVYQSALGAQDIRYYYKAAATPSGFAGWLTTTETINPAAVAWTTRYQGGGSPWAQALLDSVNKVDVKSPGFGIKTEAQLQNVLDKAITEFDQLRNFTQARKDESVVITATTILIPDLIQRYASRCLVKESDKLVYELSCPPDEEKNHIRLNRADFELIGDIASYYEAMMIVATAYNIPGLAALDLWASPKNAMQALFKQPKFGLLRSQQRLGSLGSMALDLANGLNWAQANQATLCGRGSSDPSNRPGFIFNAGFCLMGDFSGIVSALSAISNGKMISDPVGQSYVSAMKLTDFFEHPPQDLHSLNPAFNDAGALSSVSDGKFGGAFPNGDFNTVLKVLNEGHQ